jgi:hypothetical protein
MLIDRNSSWPWVALVGITAALITLQPKPSSWGDKAGGGKPSEKKAMPAGADHDAADSTEGPLTPIREFFSVSKLDVPAAARAGELSWSAEARYVIKPSQKAGGLVIEKQSKPDRKAGLYVWPKPIPKCTLRFLIATVPDPVDSGLGYYFDQVVEAMQRALETQGYVIDRHWLPWKRAEAGAPPGLSRSRLHEDRPGLILFRKEDRPCGSDQERCDPENPVLLALLLVGETPTTGMHKTAFMNSVRLVLGYEGSESKPEPIRVVGPYFSGSHASLATSLQLLRPVPAAATDKEEGLTACGRAIRVACGSANGYDPDQFFRVWHASGVDGDPGDWLKTTVLPDKLVRRWLYKFLDNPANPKRGTQPNPLVVIQETNTGFGQAATQRTRSLNGEDDAKRVFTIPFPIHISQLRASYTKEQLAKLEIAGLPRPAHTIPFPQGEDEDRGPAEAVPVQAPLMTTALNDLVLTNMLALLAQRRARHVCLVASDSRDSIFLASLLRQRSPDVQLCTTEANLLFTHPDYNYALQGMIVASTYPLQPGVQGWSETNSADQRRILFSHQSFQGYYNAVLVHLDDLPKMKCAEGDPLPPSAHMLDYGWSSNITGKTGPGVWISAVGQNGQLVPAYFVSPQDITEDLKQSVNDENKDIKGEAMSLQKWYGDFLYHREQARSQPGPRLARALLPNMWPLLFVATLLATGCGLYRAYDWLRRSDWQQVAAHEPGWAQERMSCYKQRIDFTAACIAVMVLFGWFAQMALVPVQYADWRHNPLAYAVTFFIMVASLVIIVAAQVCVVQVHVRWSWLALLFGPQLLVIKLVQFVIGPYGVAGERLAEYRAVIRESANLGELPGEQTAGKAPSSMGHGSWLRRSGFWMVCSDGGALLISFVAFGFLQYCFAGNALSTTFDPLELLWFDRLAHTPNGLSALMPVFFLCAAAFAWGLFLVKKLYLANRFSVPCPFPRDGRKDFVDLNRLDRRLRAEIMPPSTWQQHPAQCAGLLVLLSLVFGKLWHESIPPLDGAVFGTVTLACFFAGSFLLVFTLYQVYLTWGKLRRMLRCLALLPMADAFGRLPHKVVSVFGHYFSSERPRYSHLAIATHQFDLFRRWFPAFRSTTQQLPARLPCDAAGKETKEGQYPDGVFLAAVGASLEVQFGGGTPEALQETFQKDLDWVEERDYEQAARCINDQARKCLAVLPGLWPAHSMEEAFGHAVPEGRSDVPAETFLALPANNPIREWTLLAENFVAVEIIRYLSQFFIQLRNMLTSLTVGALLLLIAAAVYPFRPQYLLVLTLAILGGAVAVFMVVFLVQANRDELISRITGTTPNRFTPDLGFLQTTANYVLPIIGGILLQFPFFTSGLRALAEPLFHIIR